jgi:HK97 family phage major capsid protein
MKLTEQEIKALEDRVAKAEASAKKSEEDAATAIAAASGGYRPQGGSSDEQRALRYFGAKSVKQLLEVNTGDKKYAAVPTELKHLVRQLKEDFDISRLTQQIFHGESRDNGDHMAHVKGIMDGSHFAREVLAPRFKAFGSTVTGGGDEWVPTMVSSQYIEEFELDKQVVDQFKSMNMPSSPYDLPIQTDVTIARRQAEGDTPAVNIANANFGTGKITMLAKKLVESMALPEELNEDSAPQILSLVRQEVTEAQLRAWETAILNGDDSGTHMDNDVTGVIDARTTWKGLRKKALANAATVNFAAAAVSVANLRAMRALMGKFGVSERNLTWIVSSKVYQQMLSLPEVTTVEKFGQMATILRGALSALDGIPIVISEFMRDDLSATGANTLAGPNTFSGALLVNRSRFYWGVRRPIRVRASVDPTPPGDRWLLASWWRGDFQGHEQGAGETSVVLGRNIL